MHNSNSFIVEHWSGESWKEVKTPVFPLNFGELLDERLDELYLTVYSEQETYGMTDIFYIKLYENGELAKEIYMVAGGDKSVNTPIGTVQYKHELYLIEATKLLEGIPCQSLTFTNDLGKTYTANSKYVIPSIEEGYAPDSVEIFGYNLNERYLSPTQGNIKIISANDLFDGVTLSPLGKYSDMTRGSVDVIVNGISTTYTRDESPTIQIKNGTVEVKYFASFGGTLGETSYYKETTVTYTITVVENRLPLLPYTITDVVCRCLELAEPLFLGETPRINFDGVSYTNGVGSTRNIAKGSQAEKYSKVFAPEFTVTQANLREQLKKIGEIIHGEPRLVITRGNQEAPVFTVKYDLYGEVEEADVSKGKLTYQAYNASINEYLTKIHTNASNLVNSLDYAQGVVVEPFAGGYKSVRTDSVNARIEDTNAIIDTSTAIYSIIKVMCKIGGRNAVDITPYVLEKASYDLLSAYSDNFPEAKNLAVYYEQGQKGIKGLFFKSVKDSLQSPWNSYAIIRIVARELGISEKELENDGFNNEVTNISMQITYTPIYSTVISHSKQKYVKNQIPFAQYYNQSENLVEARYFGENVKGVAARLGNIEQERTYIFRSIKDVPRCGQMLDGYVISSVIASFATTHTKVTLGLSKDFNRISEHVGINSTKRVYEVSEREAYERHVLLHQKVVLSKDASLKSVSLSKGNAYSALGALTGSENKQTFISAQGYSKANNFAGSRVVLPVIASAFGNVIAFSWSYKDNYSAGVRAWHQSDGEASGWWAQDVPYCDYYGRIYAYDFSIGSQFNRDKIPAASDIPLLPEGTKKTDGLLLLRKDSREKLSFTLEYEYQTTEDDIIIGSALASGHPWVSNVYGSVKLYGLKKPVNKFQTRLSKEDLIGDTPLGEITIADNKEYATITFPEHIGENPVYWAVAYEIKDGNTISYENEDGEEVSTTETLGGEILFAGTKAVEPNSPIYSTLYVTIQK